jgi:hypothetical protein
MRSPKPLNDSPQPVLVPSSADSRVDASYLRTRVAPGVKFHLMLDASYPADV